MVVASDKAAEKSAEKNPYVKPTSLSEARDNRRYHGKIIVSAGGEVHGTHSEERAQCLYRRLRRKYPDEKPITTVIPKGPVLMLPTTLC